MGETTSTQCEELSRRHAEQIEGWAKGLGFDRVGFADATQQLTDDWRRYQRFVDAGMHGSMTYLARYRDVRRTIGPELLAGAQTVIVVAERYLLRSSHVSERGVARHIARYARGRDYHNHLRKRLHKLAKAIRGLAPGVQARAFCDTAPLLERAWARLAGIGFIGKNGMLIAPGIGSYLLLGEVVTSLRVAPSQPMESRCGQCTACIDACPTAALVRPYVLDARRCVSYQTIEHHGPPAQNQPQSGTSWLFGCDTCQEVCPFNRAARAEREESGPYEPFDRWNEIELADWIRASDEQVKQWGVGSPLKRMKTDDWRRNALMVMAGGYKDERSLTAARDLAEKESTPVWLRELARKALEGADEAGVAISRVDRESAAKDR